MNYKEAGVDTEKAQSLISNLKETITSTYAKAPGKVEGGFGGFAGIFNPEMPMADYNIVACTDGVGTKLQLLRQFNRLDAAGFDLVAMCVNDLYCSGATPLFFLDYISCGKLSDEWYKPVIGSIAEACRSSSMALLGGETAEHPGVMPESDFDLAGFCVGLQPKTQMLPQIESIVEGDVILALPSSGLHSNGFSLVRKILAELKGAAYDEAVSQQMQALLEPTRIYHEVKAIYAHVKALVHITGGGFYENIPRVLPKGVGALIDKAKDFNSDLFDFLRQFAQEKDLYGTFNMGVGMVIICDLQSVQQVTSLLPEAKPLGKIITSETPVIMEHIDT